MSSHIEYGKKRCAGGQSPLPLQTWNTKWNDEMSFGKSFYANRYVFSGISPKQVPQPTGKIYRTQKER